MASKLWIYGKKLTLWGAFVSSAPFMFIPVMVLSAFGVAISVPLGCAVGGYVCFRKCLSALSRKRLVDCERENSGVKKNEAEAADFGVSLESSDVNEDWDKRTSEYVGHSQVQYEKLQSEGGDDLDGNDHPDDALIYEEGYEGIITEVKPLEEEFHRPQFDEEPQHLVKLCEVETPLKWVPNDLPSVEGQTPTGEGHFTQNDEVGGYDNPTGESHSTQNDEVEGQTPAVESHSTQNDEVEGQTPAVESHSMQNDEVGVHDGLDQLTWDPDFDVTVERRIPENETQYKLMGEIEVSKGEPQLTLNPQAILIERTAAIKQIPKDEIHFSQEEKASKGDSQLTRELDAWNAAEEYSIEDETQSKLSDQMKVSEGEPQLAISPQAIQMENTAAEEQTSKGETNYNLKDEANVSDCETRLTFDNHHAFSVEKISPTYTKLRREEEDEEEEKSSEMQESPTSESRHEQDADLELEKLSSADTRHKQRELEEAKEEKQSDEIQGITYKKYQHEHGRELDSGKLSNRDIKHRRREEDVAKREEGEEFKGMREFPPNRSSNEQGAKLDGEELYSTGTKYKRRDVDEKEEEKSSKLQEVPSKRSYRQEGRELVSKGLSSRDRKHRGREEDAREKNKRENSKEMQESNDRANNEQGTELDVGKFSPSDTKHKTREKEEEEKLKSDKMQEVMSKRYFHEQDSKVELAPSTPYIENAIRYGNRTTSKTSYGLDASSIQVVSTHRVSLPGPEYDTASRDNDVADIETTLSLEVQVSSASGSDQTSKSVLESSVELDSDDNEKNEIIWEEIHAVRKIVGYKEQPHPSYTEEIKALYVFTGVEPTDSLETSLDLVKAKEKLKFLKVVVGVK